MLSAVFGDGVPIILTGGRAGDPETYENRRSGLPVILLSCVPISNFSRSDAKVKHLTLVVILIKLCQAVGETIKNCDSKGLTIGQDGKMYLSDFRNRSDADIRNYVHNMQHYVYYFRQWGHFFRGKYETVYIPDRFRQKTLQDTISTIR